MVLKSKLTGIVFGFAMVASALVATVSATAVQAATPKTPTYNLSCGTSCSTQPVVTMKACSNTAITKTVRYFVYVDGMAKG